MTTPLQRLASLLDGAAEAARLAVGALRERVETGILFNPFSPRARRDPYPLYRRLRERDPVHRSPVAEGWILFRHADCLALLRDPRFSADDRNGPAWGRRRAQAIRAGLAARDEVPARVMLRTDPPDHTRLRGLVARAFTPRAVERWRVRAEELCDELLSACARKGQFDLLADFAVPLPVTIIAEMLGVPASDRALFKRWSDDLVGFLDPQASPGAARLRETANAFAAYMDEKAAARRAAPEDDLLSALVAAGEDGARLSDDERRTTLALLLAAGNETTTNLIGNGTLALLRHPGSLERLRKEPELGQSAVEELLRWDSPVQFTARIPLEDVEVGGRRLRRGQNAILVLGSANRDPEVFAEPDRLDLGRPENRHLSLGHGAHFCLGATLARLEGEVAFRELARRFPDLRLEVAPEQLRWRRLSFLRGLRALPVRA